MIGLLCSLAALIGLLVFLERDISFNSPVVGEYIVKTFNEEHSNFKFAISSATVSTKSKLSKINIRLKKFNINEVNSDDQLSIEHVDIEFDLTSLFSFLSFEYEVTLSGLPIDIRRRIDNSIEVKFDRYQFFSEGKNSKRLFESLKNITSLKVKNPKFKFSDEITELTFDYDTREINFTFFEDYYICKTQGNFSQSNLNEALLHLTVSFFPKTGKTIIESKLQNFVPSFATGKHNRFNDIFKNFVSPIYANSVINLDSKGKIKFYSGSVSAESFTIMDLVKKNKSLQIKDLFISYKSDKNLSKVDLTKIELKSDFMKISGSGDLILDKVLKGRFSFPNVFLNFPKNKVHSLEVTDASVELNLVESILEIRDTSVRFKKTRFDVDGNIVLKKGMYQYSQFAVRGANVNPNFFKFLNIGDENIISSIFNSINSVDNSNIIFNYKVNNLNKVDYDGSISFDRASFEGDQLAKNFIINDGKIRFGIETVSFEAKDIYINGQEGSFFNFKNLSLNQYKFKNNSKLILSSSFYIDPLKNEVNFANLLLKLGLKTSLFSNYEEYILNDRLRGQLTVEWADFGSVKLNLRNFTALVQLENLSLKIPVLKHPVMLSEVEIKMSDYELLSNISGSIDGNPLNGIFRKVFIEDVAATLNLKGGINIKNYVSELSKQISISGEGLLPFKANIIFPPGQNLVMRFNGDLTNSYLECNFLGFKKEKNQSGVLNFGWTKDEPTSFKFSSGNYDFNGFLIYDSEKVIGLEFSKVKLDDYFLGKASYTFNKLQNFLLIDGVTYNHLNAPKYEFAPSNKNLQIKIKLSSVKIRSDLSLANFTGLFDLSDKFYGDGLGRLNNGPEIKVNVQADETGRVFKVFANNAGEVLLESNIYSSGYGGEIDFVLVQSPESESFGSLNVRNLRVIGAPFLAKLISLTSVKGIIDVLGSNGMIFDNISANYKINNNLLEISNGIAISPSFGLTLSGTREMNKKVINFNGVLSPAYSINGMVKKIPLIGNVLGGNEGEGAFGINYFAKGGIRNPEITVNPLSFIAPGQFRKLLN